MTILGSVDNGEVDVEYTPNPDHRQSAQEQWFRACDKRISSLELQVHRLLNAEPDARLVAIVADAYTALQQHAHPHWLTPPNVNEWLAQNNPPFAAAEHPPEADYAHIPAAEWQDICAELEAAHA